LVAGFLAADVFAVDFLAAGFPAAALRVAGRFADAVLPGGVVSPVSAIAFLFLPSLTVVSRRHFQTLVPGAEDAANHRCHLCHQVTVKCSFTMRRQPV
jgi:hypothetical protein